MRESWKDQIEKILRWLKKVKAVKRKEKRRKKKDIYEISNKISKYWIIPLLSYNIIILSQIFEAVTYIFTRIVTRKQMFEWFMIYMFNPLYFSILIRIWTNKISCWISLFNCLRLTFFGDPASFSFLMCHGLTPRIVEGIFMGTIFMRNIL